MPEEERSHDNSNEIASDEPEFSEDEVKNLSLMSNPISCHVDRAINGYYSLLKQFVSEDELQSEISKFEYYLQTDNAELNISEHPYIDVFLWRTTGPNFKLETLRSIAERILICPPSEAQTERTNGTQKKILSCLRTRTKLDLLEARLMIIQS
jgi:hypothetical protein